jgi:hypothetical protein
VAIVDADIPSDPAECQTDGPADTAGRAGDQYGRTGVRLIGPIRGRSLFQGRACHGGRIMRGPTCEGKPIASLVSREAYLANKDVDAFIPSCASRFTRYPS